MKLLRTILEQRLRSASAELRNQERELAETRSLPVLARNDEMIAMLSHSVGYLTAVVNETEVFLELVGMSEGELTRYIDNKAETERKNKEYLDKMIGEIVSRKSNKTDESVEP